ncbi:MAG: HIT domain-containing protein [Desulfuromusa sp.]|nr:HIT domain-containing protein [Desulfuromusa sp.]
MFQLDPRLQADTITLGDFPLCRLLLMDDSTYPWFVLVPRRVAATEIYQLEEADQQQLWQESAIVARWMSAAFKFDKLNLGALGNVVSQLHLHHIGRRVGDPAWPGPVWGYRPAVSYPMEELEKLQQAVRAEFVNLLTMVNES